MDLRKRPTVGLALSGSGNRTTFYIGFLEVLSESGIPIDYIAASSGGSIVAAAYACGTLDMFKKTAQHLSSDFIKQLITRSKGKGGLYSLDRVEEELRIFTKGLTFEEVRPLMGFEAVDIETGEKIVLCMGDIARAVRVSCSLPGIFDPVRWGGRTLVDGGLLSWIPGQTARDAGVDIVVGVNMRGTKYLFTAGQVTFKKILNIFKRILFIDEIGRALNSLFARSGEEIDEAANARGVFSVLGRSMDLAIAANQQGEEPRSGCDLLITPEIPLLKRTTFIQFSPYYELGRQTAEEQVPAIRELLAKKQKELDADMPVEVVLKQDTIIVRQD